MATDAMTFDRYAFNRRAVRPMVCLREGWRLLGGVYWLFLGICFVGIVIAELGPLGILVGPAFCGMHLCILRHERGLPVRFDMLFNGFHYFAPGLVAALCLMLPLLAVILATYLTIAGSAVFIAITLDRPGPHDATIPLILGIVSAILVIGLVLFWLLMQTFFFFAFPLIVDRELSGLDAVKLSFRAAWANFFGVLGLVLLMILIGLAGQLLLCVGVFLVLPLDFAIATIAYRQVFPPAAHSALSAPDDPEGPPSAPAAVETGITRS